MKFSFLLTNLCLLQILLPKGFKCYPTYSDDSNQDIAVDKETSKIASVTSELPDQDYYEDQGGLEERDYIEVEKPSTEAKTFSLPPPGLAGESPDDVNVKLGDVKANNERQAPEYMLELYERFSHNSFDLPQSNIVRSFSNINNQDVPLLPKGFVQMDGRKTRFHTMTFNITSISPRESINLAELRIFTLVERDRNTYIGVDRKVSVFEILGSSSEDENVYRLISARHIYGRNSGWETFDVTSAVSRWVLNLGSIQILEIRIESVFSGEPVGNMDINVNSDQRKEPLLVVYSNDTSAKDQNDRERHELVTHELDTYKARRRTSKFMGDHLKDVNSTTLLNREKRSKAFHRSACKRRPMFVNFEDINWHTWIIAPRGYQAFQCAGKCYFPLSEQLTPSKHAVVQTMLHSIYPRKTARTCCVPTKLEPISILYIDEQGVITFKYKYEDMVVAECGCR